MIFTKVPCRNGSQLVFAEVDSGDRIASDCVEHFIRNHSCLFLTEQRKAFTQVTQTR